MSERVISPASRPQSYVVETPTGQVEWNRSQLTVIPTENSGESETTQPPEVDTETPLRIMTKLRTGTSINPPERL